MKRFLIADTHFGDANIIRTWKRPFRNVAAMDEALLLRWNETVRKEDEVYVLGDFAWTHPSQKAWHIGKKLNGHKTLVLGNHDTLPKSEYLQWGFERVVEGGLLLDGSLCLRHRPPKSDRRPRPDFLYFHGHCHNNRPFCDGHLNCRCVCVERIDYRPIDLDVLATSLRQGMLIHHHVPEGDTLRDETSLRKEAVRCFLASLGKRHAKT